MQNTLLLMVLAAVYALSSEMDYLDAEMVQRNGRNVAAVSHQGDRGSKVAIRAPLQQSLALLEQKNTNITGR